jgi:hypothetical protein
VRIDLPLPACPRIMCRQNFSFSDLCLAPLAMHASLHEAACWPNTPKE